MAGKAEFPKGYEVKPLSPHYRFVLALYSPDGVG
jgi:hypothetical protein